MLNLVKNEQANGERWTMQICEVQKCLECSQTKMCRLGGNDAARGGFRQRQGTLDARFGRTAHSGSRYDEFETKGVSKSQDKVSDDTAMALIRF